MLVLQFRDQMKSCFYKVFFNIEKWVYAILQKGFWSNLQS